MKTPKTLVLLIQKLWFRRALVFTAGLIAGGLVSPLRYSFITLTASGAPCIYRVDRLLGTTELSLIGGPWQRIEASQAPAAPALPAGWSLVK